MPTKASGSRTRSHALVAVAVCMLAVGLALLSLFGGSGVRTAPVSQEFSADSDPYTDQVSNPRFQPAGKLTVWWDEPPPAHSTSALWVDGSRSNIHRDDYAGPESCKECHRENYELWSKHTHRWMNALASSSTVKGDFDSSATISYLGGKASFYREGDQYRMLLQRGSARKLYAINQTIGSRFFQYYVGKLIEGPTPHDHPARTVDHVLPFGYWLDRREWVPVVHVGTDELPDAERDDPFAVDDRRVSFSPYYQCNSCHTTFPLGDQMIRAFWVVGRHAPTALHWNMFDYIAQEHAPLLRGKQRPTEFSNAELEGLFLEMGSFEAPDHAVTLGVSCEACHLGAQDHAAGDVSKPSFFPHSPHLLSESKVIETDRTHDNVNWACGRCHTGDRPLYAGSMSTWNSTEYTDAMKGSCYSQLTCIDCHNPHRSIGPKWTQTALEDDASCVRCHTQYEQPSALTEHTHHPATSDGSRCMNCHMPRLNEGLQNVVRTHTIFSPTNREMIEANHPNACGLCHTDKTIDWTLKSLKAWYGESYSEKQLAANYPHRHEAAVVGWLKSDREAVRLAATDAVARQREKVALPALIDCLDDPFLLNRQFARIALEDWFQIRLEDFGYRFYMTPQERRLPIGRVRDSLLGSNTP